MSILNFQFDVGMIMISNLQFYTFINKFLGFNLWCICDVFCFYLNIRYLFIPSHLFLFILKTVFRIFVFTNVMSGNGARPKSQPPLRHHNEEQGKGKVVLKA